MNLLHIIPYYAPAWAYGGSVRAATDLTRALAAAGHQVYVLTTDTLSSTERTPIYREVIDGVQVIRVRNRSNWLRGKVNLSTPAGMQDTVRRLISKHRIEVVHCHEVRTVENWLALPVANQLGVPVVVSPHGTLPYDTGRPIIKKTWDRLLGHRMLSRFTQIIALTQNEAADARTIWTGRGAPLREEQISIVPNGVHLEDFAMLPAGGPFRERWKLGTGPVVLYLGRLQARKGVQLLIPAFAQAVRQNPDAHLLIVGPDEGMLAELRAQVAEHQIAEQVIFTGLLTGNDKLSALAAADLFTLPAIGEGFSMAVLEAMICKLPILLTPGCNFPEVVEAGAGLVVERDTGALAEALTLLLSDARRREQMGQRAFTLVQQHYTWAQVAAQLEQVYQRVSQG